MKAKIRNPKTSGRNLGDKKEMVTAISAVVSHEDELREVICARVYMGRSRHANQVWCTVWVTTADHQHISGTGMAGGYGYHKPSSAFGAAIRDAGIWLDKSIDGCGDTAIEEALRAVVAAAGYPGTPLIVRHG